MKITILAISSAIMLATASLIHHYAPQPTQPTQSGQPDISKGKVVVQFNYDWNKQNTYKWVPMAGVKYYYMSLDKFPELKSKMKITTVPTVIVFLEGKEIGRVDGGLNMSIIEPQNKILK
jgi:thiol-disulfide isomerase/thioredoxin